MPSGEFNFPHLLGSLDASQTSWSLYPNDLDQVILGVNSHAIT